MPMHNLLEYCGNCTMTSGGLRSYYRDEVNDDANENNAARRKTNNSKTITSKSFEYKTKLTWSIPNNDNILDAEVVAPSKYFSNFWWSLDLPLINCEVELDLPRSQELIILPAIAGNPRAIALVQTREARQTTRAIF